MHLVAFCIGLFRDACCECRDVSVVMFASRCAGARAWIVRVEALGDFSHGVKAVVGSGRGQRFGSSLPRDGLDSFAQASC